MQVYTSEGKVVFAYGLLVCEAASEGDAQWIVRNLNQKNDRIAELAASKMAAR